MAHGPDVVQKVSTEVERRLGVGSIRRAEEKQVLAVGGRRRTRLNVKKTAGKSGSMENTLQKLLSVIVEVPGKEVRELREDPRPRTSSSGLDVTINRR